MNENGSTRTGLRQHRVFFAFWPDAATRQARSRGDRVVPAHAERSSAVAVYKTTTATSQRKAATGSDTEFRPGRCAALGASARGAYPKDEESDGRKSHKAHEHNLD